MKFFIVSGSFGLKALSPERITARQIEAARRAITRRMRRMGKLWIRVFPDVPVTVKPAQVRMGKGKGAVEYWICRVKPGRIMFELDGAPLCKGFLANPIRIFLINKFFLYNKARVEDI